MAVHPDRNGLTDGSRSDTIENSVVNIVSSIEKG